MEEESGGFGQRGRSDERFESRKHTGLLVDDPLLVKAPKESISLFLQALTIAAWVDKSRFIGQDREGRRPAQDIERVGVQGSAMMPLRPTIFSERGVLAVSNQDLLFGQSQTESQREKHLQQLFWDGSWRVVSGQSNECMVSVLPPRDASCPRVLSDRVGYGEGVYAWMPKTVVFGDGRRDR